KKGGASLCYTGSATLSSIGAQGRAKQARKSRLSRGGGRSARFLPLQAAPPARGDCRPATLSASGGAYPPRYPQASGRYWTRQARFAAYRKQQKLPPQLRGKSEQAKAVPVRWA